MVYPDIHLAAFVLECSYHSKRLWGSFPEKSSNACSYRGELVGLMAIHPILLAINEVDKEITGRVHIYLDCLGALNMAKELPPTRIPTRCQHSNVLKNILINCKELNFDCHYSHVSAHQDNHHDLISLSRPAQLNCAMDSLAKTMIWELQATNLPTQQAFPLKPIRVFSGQTKITADLDRYVRYWVHRHLAKNNFHNLGILSPREFDYVDWEMVYDTL
jgi:hypothetical protein